MWRWPQLLRAYAWRLRGRPPSSPRSTPSTGLARAAKLPGRPCHGHGMLEGWPGCGRVTLEHADEATYVVGPGMCRGTAVRSREELVEPARAFGRRACDPVVGKQRGKVGSAAE